MLGAWWKDLGNKIGTKKTRKKSIEKEQIKKGEKTEKGTIANI